MKNYLKYDDVKVFKYDNLVLAVIYTIGHILIAMTCNRIITGASFNKVEIDKKNNEKLYLLHAFIRKFINAIM